MPDLKFFLFGSPHIESGGELIEVDTRKAIALLAYLSVNGGRIRRESMAALLWPDYDHSHALGALRRTLSSIRKALGAHILETTREIIGLSKDAGMWIDISEFQRLLASRKAHNHPTGEVCPACLTPLAEAVELYQGDFMAGFTLRDSREFEEWQFFQSEALRRAYTEALEGLVQLHTQSRDYAPAIAYTQRWLSVDTLHEPAHRWLMQLYSWSGHRNAALRQYQECVRILSQELGVKPLDETNLLYQQIKENRLPPPDSVVRSVMPPEEAHITPTPVGFFPLVDRTKEWNVLTQSYQESDSSGHFTVIEGEAGIGKTRLAEEFLRFIQSQGAFTLSIRSYEGESKLAFGLFVEGLRNALEQKHKTDWWKGLPLQSLSETSRLIPELSRLPVQIPAAPPMDSPGAQTRFFEGITQVLLALMRSSPPAVVFFDDLHWADEASLDLLAYLVRRLQKHPLYVLASWRNDEGPPGPHLRRLLNNAQRTGYATRISLNRFTREAVHELVRAAIPADSYQMSARLYQETEGLPFFVVEYLSELAKSNVRGDQALWTMPQTVRDLLNSRLSIVNETGRQLLQAGAVIGRSFDFEILREASGRSEEETVTALEDLVSLGLLREVTFPAGEPSGPYRMEELPIDISRQIVYDFSHEKVRTLIYEETSHARRVILHRRVAGALVARSRVWSKRESLAGLIAQHYFLANQISQAAEYFKLAGENAASLFANTDALAHFQAALRLGHPEKAELLEAIGDLETLAGDYPSALASFQEALSRSPSDPRKLGTLEYKLGDVWQRTGEWQLAEEHFQKALAHFNIGEIAGQAARVYADWCLTVYHQDRITEAVELAERAAKIADQAEDRDAQAQAQNMLGILARKQGDLDKARGYIERSLKIAEASGDPSARVAALNNLSLVYGAAGEVSQAIRLAEEALNLCASQGDRHREAALHNNLADLLYAGNQSEAAMVHLKQAVSIFAEIDGAESRIQYGREEGVYQPEIWKLAEW